MLVLSRHTGEKVMLGENVSVMVVAIQGDKVKLGFVGPDDLPIHRLEVFEAIKRKEAEGNGRR